MKLTPLYSAKRKALFAEVPKSGPGLKSVQTAEDEIGFTWYLKPGVKVNLFELSHHKIFIEPPEQMRTDVIDPDQARLTKLLVKIGKTTFHELALPKAEPFVPAEGGAVPEKLGVTFISQMVDGENKPVLHYQVGATLNILTGDLEVKVIQNMAENAESHYGKVELIGYQVDIETAEKQ